MDEDGRDSSSFEVLRDNTTTFAEYVPTKAFTIPNPSYKISKAIDTRVDTPLDAPVTSTTGAVIVVVREIVLPVANVDPASTIRQGETH